MIVVSVGLVWCDVSAATIGEDRLVVPGVETSLCPATGRLLVMLLCMAARWPLAESGSIGGSFRREFGGLVRLMTSLRPHCECQRYAPPGRAPLELLLSNFDNISEFR